MPSREREYYTTAPTRLEDGPVYRRHPQDWQNFHTRYVTPHVFRGAVAEVGARGRGRDRRGTLSVESF
ncbi:MAG: hypothetical protein ABR603_14220 [Pyrinomonadaceae bacterium]